MEAELKEGIDMMKLMVALQNMFRKEDGQGMVEYGLIIGLVAVAAIVALGLLGPKIGVMFDSITAKLP